MKKIFFGLMTLSMALSFASCQKIYYQVCTTKASDPSVFTSQTDRYVYENEDVKIIYNMWCDDGDRGFVMYNKTNEYINLSHYESCATSTQVGKEGEWTLGYFGDATVVAPHTYAVFESDYVIVKDAILCEGLKEKVRHSESKSFDKQNSPLEFANHITYYYYPSNGDKKVEKTLVHSFYIDRITNYKQKDYLKMKASYIVRTDKLDNGKLKPGQGMPKYEPVNRKGFFNTYIK